jgi:hypothetical protein
MAPGTIFVTLIEFSALFENAAKRRLGRFAIVTTIRTKGVIGGN